MPHDIVAIPAFNDNYIWMIIHPESSNAVVVDPGIAEPVIQALKQMNLHLSAILITHHHADHTGGIAGLLAHKTVPVYGPKSAQIEHCTHPLHDGDTVHCPKADLTFKVLAVPGHTLDHIAYLGHNRLFCGDTLFAAGCGRLFEGTPDQLHHSLERLANLDPKTLVYCAHEYTLNNLQFALTVEPNNPDIQARLQQVEQERASNLPTLPSTIGVERLTNPFLRCKEPTVQQSAAKHFKHVFADTTAVFAGLRRWKDTF